MSGIQVTSVADAIPFDPLAPSTTPTSTGYNFSWNPTTGIWEVTDRLAAHRQVWNPEITATTTSGTLTLTSTSHSGQIITGTAVGYSVVLPDARTLENGFKWEIYNSTTQTVSVKDGAGTLIFTLAQSSIAYIYLQSNATLAGVWISWQILATNVTASGIINYTVISNTPFSTSVRNPSFDIITGFTITPQSGTYLVLYNASVYYTTTPKSHWWAIYKAGVKVTNTERIQDTAHSNQTMVDSTQGVIQFNGTETCDVRVSCANTGTITVNSRSLTLVRLGN